MKKLKGLALTSFVGQKSRGFTLIELLVVIAIIGILASVVLASLNTARGKAANAAVKADLSSLRTQAEVHRDQNGSYLVGGAGGVNVCDSPQIIQIKAHIETVDSTASTMECIQDGLGASYAANAQLRVAEGTFLYWCVDSTGVSRGTAADLNGAGACPN